MNRSWISRSRQVSPLIKYSLSPDRNRRRVTTISPERVCNRSVGAAPVPLPFPWPLSLPLPLPGEGSKPRDGSGSVWVYSGSIRVRLTSAMPVAGRALVPLNTTSIMRSPRSDLALCSPSTQLMASDRLDLPQPFGPTIAAMPSANSSRVRSANDLKPRSSTRFSLYTSTPPAAIRRMARTQDFRHERLTVSRSRGRREEVLRTYHLPTLP